MFRILKTDYFVESDLRIFTAGKHIELIKIKRF